MRNVCKNLCVNLNDGICMGLCSTDPDFVQNFYDEKKLKAEQCGDKWVIIPELEGDNKVKNDVDVKKPESNFIKPKF